MKAPDEKHAGDGAVVLGSGKEVPTTRAFLCEGEAGGSLCGGFLSDGIRVCIKKTTRKKDGICGTLSHAKKGPLAIGHLYIGADGHKRAKECVYGQPSVSKELLSEYALQDIMKIEAHFDKFSILFEEIKSKLTESGAIKGDVYQTISGSWEM